MCGAGRVSAFVLVPVHDDSGLRAAGPDTDAPRDTRRRRRWRRDTGNDTGKHVSARASSGTVFMVCKFMAGRMTCFKSPHPPAHHLRMRLPPLALLALEDNQSSARARTHRLLCASH